MSAYGVAKVEPLGGGVLEIHKPKPWHGLREFLKEYLIIVVGVLTALAAEQVVQRTEWAQKVSAAEDAMRHELLFDDGPQVYQRAAMHYCLQARLDGIRAAVEADTGRAELVQLIDGYQLDFVSYDTLAHEEATHAGVADHMAQSRLDLWTKGYSMMPYMERTNAEEAQSLARLRSLRRTGGPLAEPEQSRILEAVEGLRVEDQRMWKARGWTLPAIRALGPLDAGRTKLFLDRARGWYGPACVKDLPVDWKA
jgi:hypothetical protein